MSDIQFEPEGKGLERKRVDATNESVLRAVVAFANSAGGDVAVGVDDDGTLLGVGDPIAVEERLANIVAHGVEPLLIPEFTTLEHDGVVIIVMTVHVSGRRPHHVRGIGPESGTFVRVGASSRVADAELRLELARVFREMGLIEQWGSGIARARVDAAAAGVDEPTLEELAPYRFRATIHTVPRSAPVLDEVSQLLPTEIRACAPHGVGTSVLALAVGRSERTVRDRLRQLHERGLVRAIGNGPRRRYVPE